MTGHKDGITRIETKSADWASWVSSLGDSCQGLQAVSFVSSIPLRAVHDLDSPGIVTGFVCTLQIPVLVGEGRQMFGFSEGSMITRIPW